MPTVKAPIYTKVPHAQTGVVEPCYTFNIEFAEGESAISFVADDSSCVSLQTLQSHVVDQITWWNEFMTYFLQVTAKHFSKPYTVAQINKITKHALSALPATEFPVQVSCVPASIQISGGVFLVQWNAIFTPIIIDIPVADDTEESVPTIPDEDIHPAMQAVEELNIADVPLDENTTELELDTPTKFYDKQKVKEARLKAKLAMYKAQHQMSAYYDKYGQDLTDSDEETSDDSSSDEDVQL